MTCVSKSDLCICGQGYYSAYKNNKYTLREISFKKNMYELLLCGFCSREVRAKARFWLLF